MYDIIKMLTSEESEGVVKGHLRKFCIHVPVLHHALQKPNQVWAEKGIFSLSVKATLHYSYLSTKGTWLQNLSDNWRAIQLFFKSEDADHTDTGTSMQDDRHAEKREEPTAALSAPAASPCALASSEDTDDLRPPWQSSGGRHSQNGEKVKTETL